jgi:hypothetical protein
MQATIETLEEMEALTQLMHVIGENATCVALKSQLQLIDESIWKLGDKIETYRKLTEEYLDDPYYLKQKKQFNRQEVLYLSLLKRIRENCELDQSIILYFYRRGEECRQCDDQSYVLTHLNQKIDDELAVFSFDADMGLPSVDVLIEHYRISQYPCIVVENTAYCGLHNRQEIESILCDQSPTLSICK